MWQEKKHFILPVCDGVCARVNKRVIKERLSLVSDDELSRGTLILSSGHITLAVFLSLTRAVNRMVVNWSVRSPSIFTCFFCAALQMVTVVTCHPSVEGKWFSWWRITGFSQRIVGSCRHHQSWLSCLTDPCLLSSEITVVLQMFYG